MAKINYTNKVDSITRNVANINKVTAADMNQIKSVVNVKADLNGDNTEIFKIAAAVNSDEAITKGTFDTAINALQGALIPQGNWNASTNDPDISATTQTGYYWIVSVAGSTDLGGETDWKVNDWAIKTAASWAKIDNTDKVVSVAGRIGEVVLGISDITDLQSDLDIKANDNEVVKLIGNQTIEGIKTFSEDVIVHGITVGIGVGTGSDNTAIGRLSLNSNSSGSENTAIGSLSLNSNSIGSENSALGLSSLQSNTSGSNNSAIGNDSLKDNTTGSSNSALGASALNKNTSGNNNSAVGVNALKENTTGDNNTAIGIGADVLTEDLTNSTAIGANAKVDASNKIQLGDTNVTDVATSGRVLSNGADFVDNVTIISDTPINEEPNGSKVIALIDSTAVDDLGGLQIKTGDENGDEPAILHTDYEGNEAFRISSLGEIISTKGATFGSTVTASNAILSNQLATKSQLDVGLAVKANDSSVVQLSGNQSVGGQKTFTSSSFFQDATFGGDLVIDSSVNADMDSQANGQFKIQGNGYAFAIAMGSSTTALYHTSGGRSLTLGTDETARYEISGTGDHDFKSGDATFGANVTVNRSGTDSSGISLLATGTGDAIIYFDAINGDLVGNNYGSIAQKNTGELEYNIRPSSPNPIHKFIGKATFGDSTYFGTTGSPDGTSFYGSAFIPVSTGKVQLNMASNSTSAGTLINFRNPNGTVGNIRISGTTTSYNTSSDYRLKEDLKDFNGLDMVSNIPVYNYKWKTDESRSFGVMAHELQEVLPDAVSGEKDGEEMQGVDYSKIVPLLIKSIQELTAKVEMLENK